MNVTTRKLTHSAIMIALGVVLSIFAVFEMGNGGSITIASMAPIIVISLMYDLKWAMLTSFTYSVLQLLLDFSPPPTQDFLSFILVILLDYVIAYTVIGLAGTIARRFESKVVGAAVGTTCVILLRLLCSFLSGILIWYVYTPEGMSIWFYSLSYNASYMIPELIITTVVISLLVKYVDLAKLKASASPKAA
ncbi:energy-coupled thiamine transporter ThiT [Oscillospiraceae bacterium PP1C4]